MATSLRSETAQIVRLAERDLMRLWRLVSDGASAETALRDLLPAIIEQYGSSGAALAAEWYDEQRAKVGAKGRFTALPVEATDRGSHALIGWALTEARDDASLRTLILGGVQRRVADHVRYTIVTSSTEDPAARGWQRVGSGGCKSGFCDMLIGRGAVYTEAGADFAAHDHCQCSAVPAWGGEPLPVKPYTVSPRRTIDPETGKPVVDADFLRAKQWIAEHQ